MRNVGRFMSSFSLRLYGWCLVRPCMYILVGIGIVVIGHAQPHVTFRVFYINSSLAAVFLTNVGKNSGDRSLHLCELNVFVRMACEAMYVYIGWHWHCCNRPCTD